MEFYTIEKLQDNSRINHAGIDMMTMGEAFRILDKKSENKSLDSIMNFNFIFLEKTLKFNTDENLIFNYSSKKLTFALVKPGTIFQTKDDNSIYFCAIHAGQLKIQSDKLALENIISSEPVKVTNTIEEKALNWLNNGRVGLSSATICGTLYPNLLSHHKLANKLDNNDKLEINWPHDSSDFGRCLTFLETVPEARERLGELSSLSKEWKGLVENWNQIELLFNEDKKEDCYNLIKESLGQTKRLKP